MLVLVYSYEIVVGNMLVSIAFFVNNLVRNTLVVKSSGEYAGGKI